MIGTGTLNAEATYDVGVVDLERDLRHVAADGGVIVGRRRRRMMC